MQAEIVLGDDARKFLQSDIGRLILETVDRDKQGALVELATADAEDAKKIRELQNVVWRANTFAGAIAELIQRGVDAEKILMAEEDDGRE